MRLGACALSAALVLAMTGCAASTPPPAVGWSATAAAGDVVKVAVSSSLGARLRVAATNATTSGGVTQTITLAGSYDMAADSGTMTATLPGGAIESGESVFAPDAVSVSPPTGKPTGTWGSLPRNEVKAHYLLRTPANDPAAVLHQLEHISAVERVGDETLGDVATTHVRGTLDQATLTRYLTADAKKLAGTVLGLMGVDRLPVDVWVSSDRLVARVAIAYVVGDPDAQGISSGFIIDFRATTEPVPTTVPSGASTVAATDVGGILFG